MRRERDSIDAYFDRFEAFAENQGREEGEWALMLSALLTGKALHVFSTLSKADQRDYKKLREALMKGYDLTEEGFRRKFRQARIQSGETYAQFGVRLDHYFNKWLELSDVGKGFVKLKSLLIREQILSGCGAELTVHLKERKPQTAEELLEAAEVYREARSDVKPPRLGLGQQIRTFKSERDKNGPGSPSGAKEHSPEAKNARPQKVEGRAELRECFICRKKGHIARDCRNKTPKVGALHEVPFQGGTEMEAEGSQPRDGQVGSGNLTLSGMRNAEAAAELPVRKGAIGDWEVDVLRDTECSTAVVRTSFVKGERRKCVLFDGTVREFETAKLAVSTPFLKGQLEALVMQNPLCDLIIGNVPGAKGSDDPAVAAAVETRGQRQKAMRPLSAPCGKQGVEATPLEIKGAQQGDSSLRGLFEVAKEREQKSGEVQSWFR